MPALTIRKCECGVLLRILHDSASVKQMYVCPQCSRHIEITGTVHALSVCVADPDLVRDWIRVPLEKVRNLTL